MKNARNARRDIRKSSKHSNGAVVLVRHSEAKDRLRRTER
jgi:hypothetical protein